MIQKVSHNGSHRVLQKFPHSVLLIIKHWYRLPWWLSGKEPACQCRICKRCGFNLCVGKIPWRRQWHPTLVFLPEKSHRHRLVGYSLWSHEESDTTEPLSSHTCKTLIYMWLLIKTCLFTFKSSLYLSSTKSYYPPCGTIAEAVTHWRWMALLCAGFSGL